MKRLTRVVDDFYERLGPRNWIFHDMLSVDRIEQRKDIFGAEGECHSSARRGTATPCRWLSEVRGKVAGPRATCTTLTGEYQL